MVIATSAASSRRASFSSNSCETRQYDYLVYNATGGGEGEFSDSEGQ